MSNLHKCVFCPRILLSLVFREPFGSTSAEENTDLEQLFDAADGNLGSINRLTGQDK